jgi:TrmH family RNA methyltransferase
VIGSDEVTSIRSPRVKAARQLARRSSRQRTRLFLAEGPQAVREALAWSQAAPQPGDGPRGVSGRPGAEGAAGASGQPEADGAGGVVTELFVTAEARSRHDELTAQAAARGVPVLAVSGR